MTEPRTHQCRPLWIAGSIRATCDPHFWQPLANTGAPTRAGLR